MTKMTDEQLRQVLDEEIQQSVAWASDSVREDQIRNLQYFLGFPMGNEVAGRSQVVSWDVFEIVESAMPGFIEPFFGADNIGEFSPRGPEDEEFAGQATDYVNYVIKDRNEGFTVFNTWIKDALLSKIGVVRADWEDAEPKRLQLQGLSDQQMAMLAQDPDVQIIEHSVDTPPGMPAMNEAMAIQAGQFHSVTMLQKQAGCVKIDNVRPENFIVSRDCGTITKARVVGEIVVYTRSDLKSMGFRKYADVQSFDFSPVFETQAIDALRDTGTVDHLRENAADPALDEVKLFRGYIRADVDGDGVAEWRRVLVGGDSGFLENEEAEFHDYCVLTPIPIPHRVIGMAYADPASEIQRIKTSLTRQYLDSLYLANRPRTYVNTAAGVNIDDLLSDRIGGLVRGTQPYNMAIAPIQTTAVARDALEGIQFADGMRETRLGIPKFNPGLEPDALHKTATGVRSVNNLVDKRQKMTLRIMAETGIKDLFRLVLRLCCKYQDRATTVRLRNKWVEFDPRQWNPDMDVTIDVGVGTSDNTEMMAMLQQFAAYMQWGQANGCVTPQNVYEFGKLLSKASKIRGAEERLITEPGPPQPPPPPPEIIKAQMQAQTAKELKGMELQDSSQKFQAEQQSQMAVDANRQEWEARQKQLELQQQAELERVRAEFKERERAMDIQFQQWKAQFDRETQLMLEQFRGEQTEKQSLQSLAAQHLSAQDGEAKASESGQKVDAVAQAIQGLAKAMSAPKRLVRDGQGRPVGVESVGTNKGNPQ